MGQKLSASRTLAPNITDQRQISDDLCRPSGLYSSAKSENLDLKKLKALVRSGRIAPFYHGVDDDAGDCISGRDISLQLEECSICLLNYPVLNSSSCCSQRLCSDCFVQIQTTAARPGCAPCPFCKDTNFAVRFLGAKSSKDWERERQDEHNVAQAKLRQHQAQIVREQQHAWDMCQQQRHASSSSGSSAAAPHTPTSNSSSGRVAGRAATQRSSGTWSPGWQQVVPDLSQEAVDGASVTHHIPEPPPPPPQPTASLRTLRRLLAADYIPAAMVDMHSTMSLDDLNQLMLEQALLESVVVEASAGSSSGAPLLQQQGVQAPAQVALAQA